MSQVLFSVELELQLFIMSKTSITQFNAEVRCHTLFLSTISHSYDCFEILSELSIFVVGYEYRFFSPEDSTNDRATCLRCEYGKQYVYEACSWK